MPAEKLLIIGDSGCGKSTSLENLNPETTFIINCVGKDLPFRGWKKSYSTANKNIVHESSAMKIKSIMMKINSDEKFKHVKTIIIDDFNYVPAYNLFDKSDEKGWN